MHIKTFSAADWSSLSEPPQLVKMSSRGLLGGDKAKLVKQAGEQFAHLVSHIQLLPGQEPVHLTAMGAYEFFGNNRNGDGFETRELQKHARTFETSARHYRNHANKNSARSYGRPKLAFYNPAMHRVELLDVLNGTKEAADRDGGLVADKELEILESGKELPVSMACFTDPKYPVLTQQRGYVPIAELQPGELVFTHMRRWRRITAIRRRVYSGTVYRFRLCGVPWPIELTADHPMLARLSLRRRRLTENSRAFLTRAEFDAAPVDWTHAEHIQPGDRFFCVAGHRYPGYGKLGCRDLAALLGYYMAEGSLAYNPSSRPSTVMLTCHMDDAAVRNVPQLMSRIYPDITVEITPKANSAKAVQLSVFSTQLACLVRRLCREGCHEKLVPGEIFNSDRDVQLSFVGAWLDGDGFVDVKGAHVSTCSENLALQLRDLLLNLDIAASIYRIDHSQCETSGYAGSGVEYIVNISHCDTAVLTDYSWKIAEQSEPRVRRKPPSLLKCENDLWAVAVREVDTRTVVDCQTYNIEVESDESFTAAGLVSHNCSIDHDICQACGNKAPTRKQYCKSAAEGGACTRFGCSTGLTKVADDGFVQGLYNPRPQFFDISTVDLGADKIAFGHLADYLREKQAAALGSSELSERMGLTLSLDARLANTPPELRSLVKVCYALAALEDDWEPTAWRMNLARAFDPVVCPPIDLSECRPAGGEKSARFAKELAHNSVLLSLPEFARLTGVDASESVTKAASAALPGVFTRLVRSEGLVDLLRSQPLGLQPILLGVNIKAASYCFSHGLSADSAQLRCATSAIKNPDWIPVFAKEGYDAATDAARQLAKEYAAYKVAFINHYCEQAPLTYELVLLQNYICR